MDPDAKIEILVHTGGEVLPIVVSLMDSIWSVLNKAAVISPSVLVYNETVLSNAFSCAFYGIKDGSHLYTVPITPAPPVPTTEADLFQNKEFNKMVENLAAEDGKDPFSRSRTFSDFDTRREFARLRDMFWERLEGTISCHRRMIQKWFSRKEKEKSDDEDATKNPHK
jgi:hypothetical protein